LGRDVVRIPEILYFHRELPNSRSQQMTQDYWVKSYTQIFTNHRQLYSDHMDVLFRELVELRDDVHQTHSRLHEAQLELVAVHEQLMQTQMQAQAFILEVENSKFWYLRNQWLKLKQWLGLVNKPSLK
jgi:hypothetical protein